MSGTGRSCCEAAVSLPVGEGTQNPAVRERNESGRVALYLLAPPLLGMVRIPVLRFYEISSSLFKQHKGFLLTHNLTFNIYTPIPQ